MSGKSEEIKARILKFLRENGNGKSTGEVMRAFNLTRGQTQYYLTMLVVEGKVKRVKKSPRVILWYPIKEV